MWDSVEKFKPPPIKRNRRILLGLWAATNNGRAHSILFLMKISIRVRWTFEQAKICLPNNGNNQLDFQNNSIEIPRAFPKRKEIFSNGHNRVIDSRNVRRLVVCNLLPLNYSVNFRPHDGGWHTSCKTINRLAHILCARKFTIKMCIPKWPFFFFL